MSIHVSARNVSKVFPSVGTGKAVVALDAIDLSISAGEFCVLVGDSGSGKTTLMRSIAGLERPTEGEIQLRGSCVFSASDSVFVPPQLRRIGMVFQSYAIWPHLTVEENVGLALSSGTNKVDPAEARRRTSEAIEVVGLGEYAKRPSPALSGGQQQRVALARALAVSNDLLIMDEPMSNLDARLREEVRWQIRDITRKFGTTVLYVTHDQSEAMALADEIAIVRSGQILVKGSPEDLYDNNSVRAVADFFGPMNYLEGTVAAAGTLHHPEFGDFKFECGIEPGTQATIGMRASQAILTDAAGPNTIRGEVVDEVYQGGNSLVSIKAGETIFKSYSRLRRTIGETAYLQLPANELRPFDN